MALASVFDGFVTLWYSSRESKKTEMTFIHNSRAVRRCKLLLLLLKTGRARVAWRNRWKLLSVRWKHLLCVLNSSKVSTDAVATSNVTVSGDGICNKSSRRGGGACKFSISLKYIKEISLKIWLLYLWTMKFNISVLNVSTDKIRCYDFSNFVSTTLMHLGMTS